MKRNIVLFFALIAFGFTHAQTSHNASEKTSEKTSKKKKITKVTNNKFGDVLNTRKLGYIWRDVKDSQKEDFYQQYYWMKKAEDLTKYEHLKGIKPRVFYSFVREVNPQIPTKSLEEGDVQIREEAELSLDQYFKNRDFENNQILTYNLASYVDPYDKHYHTKIEAEKIKVLVDKKLYGFAAYDEETGNEKNKYLWINTDKDKHKIVDIVPNEKDNGFYDDLNIFMPGFTFPEFMPTVEMGDKRNEKDRDYFYITPFQMGNNNIVYRTKDFDDFELVKIKKNGGPWNDIDIKKE